MKRIIILLLLSNISWAQTVKLDTNSILIGEQTKLHISHVLECNYKINWPIFNDTIVNGIEIIKSSNLDTLNNNTDVPIIQQSFTITAWDSGSYYIPPIAFSEKVHSEGLRLNVQTITIEEGAELKDIKQPMNAPFSWSDIWPWLLALLVIALIMIIIKKYIFSQKDRKIKLAPKVIIPADVIALTELEKLEKEKIWETGNIKRYHTALSEIIRRYIENRFKFIALELTTPEIIETLQGKITIEEVNKITTLLQRADLAKFAKSKPIDIENIESMELAKDFVFSTKEKKEDE